MNNAQRAHFDDPECLAFDANIIAHARLADGRLAAALDHTFFYATGGGQEHDNGLLQTPNQTAQVSDVLKEEDAGPLTLLAGALPEQATLHVVDRLLPLGPLHAQIDPRRRWRHRQHHTAQHLLTYCFAHLFGYQTVSANINGDSPSTLDLLAAEISDAQALQAENLANAEIYANLPVTASFVTPEEAARLPLRKALTVTENIRIIDIDRRDFSACGGSHVTRTGAIGVVKIVRLEKVKEKTRLHFVAGEQALELFQSSFATLSHLANSLSAHPSETPAIVERMSEQIKSLQSQAAALRQRLIPIEAQELAVAAAEHEGLRLVIARLDDRPPAELRLLAQALRGQPNTVAYLAAYDGNKLSLVVSCSPASGQDAAARLRSALALISGKGGGDATLAQGGGPATPQQVAQVLAQIQP